MSTMPDNPKSRGKLLVWGTKGILSHVPPGGEKRSSSLAVMPRKSRARKSEVASAALKEHSAEHSAPPSREGGARRSQVATEAHYYENFLPRCLVATMIRNFVLANMYALSTERRKWLQQRK